MPPRIVAASPKIAENIFFIKGKKKSSNAADG
jgi:hypothetical protein